MPANASTLRLASCLSVLVIGAPGLAIADQVIPDDLIVQSSLCVGFDCVNDESFGFDTVRLKENNLRIKFEDTSVGTFPSNDWEIEINASASGGSNHFAIRDVTSNETLFRLCAVADPTCTPIVPSAADPQVAQNTSDIALLNSDVAANGTAIGALQTTVAGNTTRIDAVENTVDEHGTQIGALNTAVTTNTGRIGTLETTSQAHAGAISDLQTTARNHEGRIGRLENRMDSFSADLGSVKTGVAVAIALGGAAPLQSDQNGAVAVNLGTFAGRTALGVVGSVRLDDNLTMNLGVGSGFDRDNTGGRIGLQFAW